MSDVGFGLLVLSTVKSLERREAVFQMREPAVRSQHERRIDRVQMFHERSTVESIHRDRHDELNEPGERSLRE